MDISEALVEVTSIRSDFVQLDVLDQATPYAQDHPQAPQVRSSISRRLNLVITIADEVKLHDIDRLRKWNGAYGHSQQLAACDELIGLLGGQERFDQVMGVQGPKLAAASMHPWVWNAAAQLWEDGHRRAAVQQAASAIFDGYVPAALGVPKGDSSSDPSSAFSDKSPAPNSPRFHLPGFTEGTADWSNAHEGAKFLGMACQKYVRNLSTHSPGEIDEDEALEQLAMLSLFARLVNSATVVKNP